MTGPDFVIWLETTTETRSPTDAGGAELLPGRVVQACPHVAVALSANPLNDAGAPPPLSVLSFHHCAPQKVTWAPTEILPNPTEEREMHGTQHAHRSKLVPALVAAALAMLVMSTSATADTASSGGAFVIGDQNAAVGAPDS